MYKCIYTYYVVLVLYYKTSLDARLKLMERYTMNNFILGGAVLSQLSLPTSILFFVRFFCFCFVCFLEELYEFLNFQNIYNKEIYSKTARFFNARNNIL